MLLASIAACSKQLGEVSAKNDGQQILKLEGSQWASDFFYYHNEYLFETATSGRARDGQFIWSTAIDPKEYEGLPDSTYSFQDDKAFKYSLKDSTLKISFIGKDFNSHNRHRVFHAKQMKSGDLVFVSEYEYAYGREYLLCVGAGNGKE
jgi:hypothetical protein